jgi:hypothetical protein
LYPDAEVASGLCHGGPSEYAINEGSCISNTKVINHQQSGSCQVQVHLPTEKYGLVVLNMV